MSLRARLRLAGRDGRPRLDVDLELPAEGVTAVFGPSGAGKTTLLRSLAGLEPQAAGRVALGDEAWQDDGRGLRLPPHRRPVGFVFQDGQLFPHLTVAENLAFGRRRRAAEAPRPEEVTELLGLGGLLTRDPRTLSGGERQRTALARALLAGPRLLLLDEPLASLDRPARRRILPYLERIRRHTSVPVVLVSHDLDEAARLADHLVRLEDGRAVGDGPLQAMLTTPDPGLALEPDAGAVLEATVGERLPEDHLARLRCSGGELLVTDPGLDPGANLRVRVLARDVSLTRQPSDETSILNILPVRVLQLLPRGEAQMVVRLELGDDMLLAAITRRSARRLDLRPGAALHAQVKSVAVL